MRRFCLPPASQTRRRPHSRPSARRRGPTGPPRRAPLALHAPLVIWSWHAASLSAGDGLAALAAARHRRKMDFVLRLARGAHAIALQEAYRSERDLTEIATSSPGGRPTTPSWRSVPREALPSCISPALVALYFVGHASVTVLGRIAVRRMRGPKAPPVDIVNLHLVPIGPYTVAAKLRRLSENMSPLREAVAEAVGGISMSSPGEVWLDFMIGQLSVDNSPLVDLPWGRAGGLP